MSTMTLEQVRDELRATADHADSGYDKAWAIRLADAIDAYLREREALKRDAERYRWLRSRMSVHRHRAMPDRYGLDEYFLSEGIDELNDDQYLDEAIDAAMREGK